MYLDLWHGRCRQASANTDGDPGMPKPAFTLRAPAGAQLRDMERQREPMHAMVTTKLKVESNLAKMLLGVHLVLDPVRICDQVEIVS